MVSCCVLFGLLCRLLCTGTRGQNQHFKLHLLFVIYRVRTLFQKQISRTFPGPRLIITASHTFRIFLVEFNIFPELSRSSGLFPGFSSPGKCQNKIPGLSSFSRTRTNPEFIHPFCEFLKRVETRLHMRHYAEACMCKIYQGRALCGQHQEPRPLGRSNSESPRFPDFPSLCASSG